MNKLLTLIFITTFFLGSNVSFGQSSEEGATINFYRLKESMMSGGRAMNIKILFDGKEVTALQTNMKLTYKLFTTGTVKVKCIGELMGGPIGSPYVETFDFEKGKEYHISIEAGSMFGVKGKAVNEKGLKKINKNKFADSTVLEEQK